MSGLEHAPAAQLDLLDASGLAEQAGRRLTLADLAAAAMAEHERTNTTRAFRADWQTWSWFAEVVRQQGMTLDPLDPDPRSLVVFAKWLAIGGRRPDGGHVRPHAPESIRRRLTGVLDGWRSRDVDYRRHVTKAARQWVAGYQAQLVENGQPLGRGQAPVLEIDVANLIARTTPHDLAGRRDLALVLLGFAIGARSSELSFLDVPDVTPQERGVKVHVRKSKTKPRHPAVIFGQSEATCPVLAWRRWQEHSGVIAGAAFRAIDRHGNLGGRLSPTACSDVVKRAGQRVDRHRAQLAAARGDQPPPPLNLTGHSLRAGFATAATVAGKRPDQIADQAGWGQGSEAMHRYIRGVREWDDNVLSGIGL